MKLYGAAAMKKADDFAIEELNISSLTLMENAAQNIADAAERLISPGDEISVFCGAGNNGGDGIAAARIMTERGYTVRVFLVGDRERLTPDSKEMYYRLKALGAELEDFLPELSEQEWYITHCALIIDAIFGIGLKRPVEGVFRDAVELINSSPAAVLSADIPSGVEADTGNVLGAAVKADVTVTFSAGKPGHFILPGGLLCGEVSVCGIGIPQMVLASEKNNVFAVTKDDVRLPARAGDAHKGDFGRALIIGGSVGFSGAPCLAAEACVRSGAGLVFLGVPEKLYMPAAVKCNEAMPFPLPCDEDGIMTEDALGKISEKLAGCDVCLIGPGLGQSESADRLVYSIIKAAKCPIVIDADGINAVSRNIDILKSTEAPVILTPHDGEFMRLGGDLSRGRLRAALEFSEKHGCITVLKGRGTITAFPDGDAFVNTTGNPGMAKGGSGDVLAGMTASLIGQGLPLKRAVPYAVFLHGLSGDICAEKYGEYSMTPSDIISELPAAFKTVL